jgi:hypothetical protein
VSDFSHSPNGASIMPAPRATSPSAPDHRQLEWATPSIAALILVRAAIEGGTTRAELARDLRPLLGPMFEGTPPKQDWRAMSDAAIVALIGQNLLTETRGRLRATENAASAVSASLGAPMVSGATWRDVREGQLTARALDLDAADRATLKALATPDGLRALIVQHAFGLGEGKPLSLSKLRAGLALRALERAFGNQIKRGMGTGQGLATKPSRVLAGQLSKVPRDYGTDGRLISALATEHLGAQNAEAETLRLALLRRFVTSDRFHGDRLAVATLVSDQGPTPRAPIENANAAIPAPSKSPANDPGRDGSVPLPAARPDLPGFIRVIQAIAASRAQGWPGNRKAFISHVWQGVQMAHPQWALTEIEFKGMLAEAHRSGGVVLASADLKDKKFIQDFELSAIQYKNTVWHFVRVEESN